MTTCPIVLPIDAQEMRIEADARTFYKDVLRRLDAARIPYLVGGAFAMSHYAGVTRDTKDLDLFIRPEQWRAVERLLAGSGYHVELTFPHWLGKTRHGHHYVDFVFNSGNGMTPIDDEWFLYAQDGELFGVPVKLCPPEECLWSKCFVMERERFDGADVAHLIRGSGPSFDWARLVRRFGDNWRVLLAHAMMFQYIYPGERDKVPSWVMKDLLGRAECEVDEPVAAKMVCRGTLVSRAQYLVDIENWGYRDARLRAEGGGMSADQVAVWTDAINKID